MQQQYGTIAPHSPGETDAVDRVDVADLTTQQFHRRYRIPGRPVVIRGAFPGVDWNLELLESRIGDVTFNVSVWFEDHSRLPRDQWKPRVHSERYSVREFVQMLRDGRARERDMYLSNVDVGGTALAASIREQIEALGRLCDMRRRKTGDMVLWLGASGHTEPLHIDIGDTTLIQVHGSKRVVLFPPSQTEALYPFPLLSAFNPRTSQVCLANPDEQRWPRLGEALKHRLELVLEQGDTLFIPINWWHEITGLGDSYTCSVSRLWDVKPFSRNFCTKLSTVLFPIERMPVQSALKLRNVGARIVRVSRRLMPGAGRS